jgi:hypothetical protein
MTARRISILVLPVLAAAAAGTYLGVSRAARASPSRTQRVVYLRYNDVAVFGGVQCIATAEAGYKYLLCQRRPRASAPYEVGVTRDGIDVYKLGSPDPVYVTPHK